MNSHQTGRDAGPRPAPKLKSPREIGLMREAGRVVAKALHRVTQLAVPGSCTAEFDEAVAAIFKEHDATPLFRNYPNSKPGKPAFPACICASLNEAVVHGIPSRRPLKSGDVISIDTGCKVNGWCGDAAITLAIGEIGPDARKLLDVTKETLDLAISAMGRCKTWSEVASLMERYVRSQKMAVVEQFVGHGIGQNMHEEPQVPNFVNKDLEEEGLQAGAGPGHRRRADGRAGDQERRRPQRPLDRRHQGSSVRGALRAHGRHDARRTPHPDAPGGLIQSTPPQTSRKLRRNPLASLLHRMNCYGTLAQFGPGSGFCSDGIDGRGGAPVERIRHGKAPFPRSLPFGKGRASRLDGQSPTP